MDPPRIEKAISGPVQMQWWSFEGPQMMTLLTAVTTFYNLFFGRFSRSTQRYCLKFEQFKIGPRVGIFGELQTQRRFYEIFFSHIGCLLRTGCFGSNSL